MRTCRNAMEVIYERMEVSVTRYLRYCKEAALTEDGNEVAASKHSATSDEKRAVRTTMADYLI